MLHGKCGLKQNRLAVLCSARIFEKAANEGKNLHRMYRALGRRVCHYRSVSCKFATILAGACFGRAATPLAAGKTCDVMGE